MTGDGRDREARRVQRSMLSALFTALSVAIVALQVGLLVALVAAAALLVAVYAVGTAIVWRARRAELRRRAEGAAPSWPAQLPVLAARRYGMRAPGRHSAGPRQEHGEYLGRLILDDDELRWEPRPADRARGVGPVTWDRSWSAEVVPLWGPGSPGCLTMTQGDGAAVDIWIRHPADLSRALGLAGSV